MTFRTFCQESGTKSARMSSRITRACRRQDSFNQMKLGSKQQALLNRMKADFNQTLKGYVGTVGNHALSVFIGLLNGSRSIAIHLDLQCILGPMPPGWLPRFGLDDFVRISALLFQTCHVCLKQGIVDLLLISSVDQTISVLLMRDIKLHSPHQAVDAEFLSVG